MRVVAAFVLLLISVPFIGFFGLVANWPRGGLDLVGLVMPIGNVLMLWIAAFYSIILGLMGNVTDYTGKIRSILISIFLVISLVLVHSAYPFRAGAALEGAVAFLCISLFVFVVSFAVIHPIDPSE